MYTYKVMICIYTLIHTNSRMHTHIYVYIYILYIYRVLLYGVRPSAVKKCSKPEKRSKPNYSVSPYPYKQPYIPYEMQHYHSLNKH